MKQLYKPEGYNSVSPYLVVNGAQEIIDLLEDIFKAETLRRFDMPDGSVMHAEVVIDDSIIMLGDSSEQFPPNTHLLHVYVSDVDKTYNQAIASGCQAIESPVKKDGDPDKRGTFKDFAGNIWSVATQVDPDN